MSRKVRDIISTFTSKYELDVERVSALGFSSTHCNISLWPVVQEGADVSSVPDGDKQASGKGNKMNSQTMST